MITKQEYLERMQRLQQKVRDHALDVFLVSGEESIYYLTGVSYRPLERPFFILVWPDCPAVLLVPALEGDHLRAAPNVGSVCTYWEYPSPAGEGYADQLDRLLKDTRRLGVEPGLTQEIASRLAGCSFAPLPLVEELRLVKSPAEVEMVRQAARFADEAVRRVIAKAYDGVSELELFSQGRAVQTQIIKGGRYDVLTTNVLAGAWPAPLSAQPHSVPSISDRLGAGPHIALALLRVNGYAAECERTFFLRDPSPEAVRAFHTMLEARRRAAALVRPGASGSEIDCRTKEFLRAEGYGEALMHRTGHGFGLGNHEGPWVAEGSTEILQENMLISIEPGIYLPGVGGVRHSDTFLVTRDGCEPLTHYPTGLVELTVRAAKPVNRLVGALTRRAVGMK
jgi:Xaa-Pro aminopeptidase